MSLFDKTKKLIELLKRKNLKIAFAESCTGGQLSSAFSEHAGVSEVFLGSVIAYSNSVKKDILSVDPSDLLRFGAVSSEVALQMAKGILQNAKADCAISVTGIAGPSGGSLDKPVGTVWFGFVGPNFEFTTREIFAGERTDIQNKSVEFAIDRLFNELNT